MITLSAFGRLHKHHYRALSGAFTGTLHRVVVSVDGEPFRHALQEVVIAMGRD